MNLLANRNVEDRKAITWLLVAAGIGDDCVSSVHGYSDFMRLLPYRNICNHLSRAEIQKG
jgi:hypothetical protein